jgi:hypothetical protein
MQKGSYPDERLFGRVAKWLCSGLQSRLHRFDSDLGLQFIPLRIFARVAELVDAGDLKSPDGNIVSVQVRPRALY